MSASTGRVYLWALSAPVSVFGLNVALQGPADVSIGNGNHEFVAHKPCDELSHSSPQIRHDLRQVRLGQTRQEIGRPTLVQRRLPAVGLGSRRPCCMVTIVAPLKLTSTAVTMPPVLTVDTASAARSAGSNRCLSALRLVASSVHELPTRHTYQCRLTVRLAMEMLKC